MSTPTLPMTPEERTAHIPLPGLTYDVAILVQKEITDAIRAAETDQRERDATLLDEEADRLEAEQKRIASVSPKHASDCKYAAYHCRRYASAIRGLSPLFTPP